MPPVDGQAHHDNRMPPGLAIGVLGRALIFARVLLWLLLLLGILPLALLWRLFTRRRVWPQIYLRGFCAVMGVRLRVHGTPGGNALYLPNHMSWMDIPAILAASGSAFVANDGLAQSPLFRLLAGMNDTVFIARHRRATIGAQVADVRRAVIDAGALTIFIEGTTSDAARRADSAAGDAALCRRRCRRLGGERAGVEQCPAHAGPRAADPDRHPFPRTAGRRGAGEPQDHGRRRARRYRRAHGDRLTALHESALFP